MAHPVIVAPRAARDLERIVRYISVDNPARAVTFGRELTQRARAVAEFPLRGRIVPEFGDLNIREVIHGSYRIVYRVKAAEGKIEIARFWHAAQGLPRV